MKINVSRTTHAGAFRTLKVDCYRHTPPSTGAVIMATAFIENGYWYQIEKKGYSLARNVAQEGFDVYVLSFEPNLARLKKKHLPPDTSFRDIVCDLLPHFHKSVAETYQTIHYVGHSYGVTLLLAFLLGYEKQDAGFRPIEKKAHENQDKVRSFTSVAGLFKLAWPDTMPLLYEEGLRALSYPTMRGLLKVIPFAGLKRWTPIVPTSQFAWLRFAPSAWPMQRLLRIVEKAGMTPSFHFSNVDFEALQLGLSKGSSDETWESFLTILGLVPEGERIRSVRSNALKTFTEDLRAFSLPILFLQGEYDQITHLDTIRKYGFEAVGSSVKNFVNLKNTGHQDIMASRHPHVLFREVRNWLLAESQ
ncbi:MAG: hypothetical protein HYW48_07905 [Deltaproteobacteria bacterium]|nr:hypothetical protein [Deltaproteobacteria bacterium]